MDISRLDQLIAFFEEDPNDPFNAYSLALEYSKSQLDKALHYFEWTLENHPSYQPTYYHLGKLYQDLKEYSKAEMVFLEGLALAEKTGKAKDVKELKNAIQQLEDEQL